MIVFTDFLIKRQMEGEHLLNDRSALVDSLVVSIISKRVTLTNFVRTHGGISLFDHHSFFFPEKPLTELRIGALHHSLRFVNQINHLVELA